MSRFAAFASLTLLLSQVQAAIQKVSSGSLNGNGEELLTSFQRADSTTINLDGIGNSDSCPNGWENSIYNGDSKCCPGAVYNMDDNSNNEDSAYCCVGATYSVARPSFSSCFPFCSQTGTDSGSGVTVLETSKQPCSATVMLTDADYSSKVSSASASISGSSGAMTTGSSSGSAQTSSSSDSAAAQTGSSSSSSAGAAMVTSGPLAGALMIAGGLLFV